jgi:hypothetical protein
MIFNSTACSANKRSVQRDLPSGAVLQAKAMSRASCAPSKARS